MSEIKKNMTQGEWGVMKHAHLVLCDSDGNSIASFSTRTSNTTDLLPMQTANFEAARIAVNATYGAGIDPLKVGEMVRMLDGLSYEFKLSEVERNNIQNLLKSIRI